jgi:deazaflavin-dependent oxidoreductase (nitroreductase family)
MVASQGGSSAHPRWYSNLVADPLVELRDGTHTSDRVAREVLVAERDQWWGGPLLPFRPTPSSSYGPSGSSPCSYSSPFPTDRRRRDRQAGLPAKWTSSWHASSAPSIPQLADDVARLSGNRDARTLARSGPTVFTGVMSLTGEYEPSSQQWVRDQVALYESSGGTEGTTLLDTGMPVIVVTNRGASTGKIRKTPLMRVEHGGIYALVASQGGAPAHPLWYRNLVKEPQVELRDGPVTSDRVAREVEGDERALWWERAVAAYPPYAEYQERTDRVIPVLVLEPAIDQLQPATD